MSQRTLAKELGIALGLTNLIVKRLIRKGWVRAILIRPNRVRYFITPAGIAEKTRMSRAYFESTVQFYRQTKDRIQQRFSVLSRMEPDGRDGRQPARIVFYGAGEVAEIGYICLAERELALVGVVEASRATPFFGLNVSSPEDLRELTLNGQAFDWLVVMSFGEPAGLGAALNSMSVPLDRVFWL